MQKIVGLGVGIAICWGLDYCCRFKFRSFDPGLPENTKKDFQSEKCIFIFAELKIVLGSNYECWEGEKSAG